MTEARPRLALWGAASCGGCELAWLDLDERFLALAEVFEIVVFPMVTDRRWADFEAQPDASVDLGIFVGAIRTREDLVSARQFRSKVRWLVAFGSCAHEGCVPGLANLEGRDRLWSRVASTKGTEPARAKDVAEAPGSSPPELPELLPRVLPLQEIVDVDFLVPGCPPERDSIWSALDVLESIAGDGNEEPGGERLLGAELWSLCEECPLERREDRVQAFVRVHEATPDPARCLLEQGFVCSGIATHGGCGARCLRVGLPCRGCYGAIGEGDSGARMVSALAATLEAGSDDDLATAAASLADPAGTLYRFSLARSLLCPPCDPRGDDG